MKAKLVVVAEVVVAKSAVKFWRVVEPERRRFESDVNPPVAVRVVPMASDPVRFALEVMVCPLIKPEVIVFEPAFRAPLNTVAPKVETPAFRIVANRFVEDAVVAKKLVVVADVPVAFRNVKF